LLPDPFFKSPSCPSFWFEGKANGSRCQKQSEEPEARNIGFYGNCQIVLDHRPAPYLESLNSRVDIVPSLSAYQRAMRLREPC